MFSKLSKLPGTYLYTFDDGDGDDDDNRRQHMPLQGHHTCQRYALSEKCDFSLDVNKSRVDAECMDVGMLFQHLSPATEKARSLKQVFDFQTFRSPLTLDRRRALDLLYPLLQLAPGPENGFHILRRLDGH